MKEKLFTFLKTTKFGWKARMAVGLLSLFIIFFYFLLPNKIFNSPYCAVITSEKGELLSARIASDGQYRFPSTTEVPIKFEQAILTFEDKRFHYHLGFDPIAFARATYSNISQQKIISGGSTLTMQVIRLSRNGKKRDLWQKFIETLLAIRLEFSYSKDEILNLYSSHAPFGGNVVGLETAAWRYFGRSANQLSWGETATLAVLPNSPALIHTKRNRTQLLKKRNRLLKKMLNQGVFDTETYELAIDEPIPKHPKAFPGLARHLLSRAAVNNDNSIIHTTLDVDIQKQIEEIIQKFHNIYKGNGVNNLSALVLDTESGKTIAYIGNIKRTLSQSSGTDVDIITSERSTGSILKPFLFAANLDEGILLQNSLILDIPTRTGSYSPKNYNKKYDGAVPASEALSRSLNVPAVRMLRSYGVPKFHSKLEKTGMTTLHNPASHYGLSLILGGSEATLWELCGMYASLGRTLSHYTLYGDKYYEFDFHPAFYRVSDIEKHSRSPKPSELREEGLYSASSIWHTFTSLLEVERPDNELGWRQFTSTENIAWKTGTSFGFRDAWAIGLTPKYTVGVWVGNADGEGRPGLVGVRSAAPVMFEIFSGLEDSESWFIPPTADLEIANICKKSGMLASHLCPETDSVAISKAGIRSDACKYHKLTHLDKSEEHRVKSCCESVDNMVAKAWFILPPASENYYKQIHPEYRYLPTYREDCIACSEDEILPMELLYPYHNLKIFIPTELDGKAGKAVFEAAHRKSDTEIFWFIDEKYIGKTTKIHQIEVYPTFGKHRLTLTDTEGNKIIRNFEITNE